MGPFRPKPTPPPSPPPPPPPTAPWTPAPAAAPAAAPPRPAPSANSNPSASVPFQFVAVFSWLALYPLLSYQSSVVSRSPFSSALILVPEMEQMLRDVDVLVIPRLSGGGEGELYDHCGHSRSLCRPLPGDSLLAFRKRNGWVQSHRPLSFAHGGELFNLAANGARLGIR